MFVGPMMPLAPIVDGSSIALTYPPQGGHVLLVGAQMQNLATDTIRIRGRLLDPTTMDIVDEESRTVVVRPSAADPSIYETDPDSYSEQSNIPACPDVAPRAIDGQPYLLEITVQEIYVDAPRTVTATRTVIPTCPADGPDAALCACECAGNYVLGTCPADLGDAGPLDSKEHHEASSLGARRHARPDSHVRIAACEGVRRHILRRQPGADADAGGPDGREHPLRGEPRDDRGSHPDPIHGRRTAFRVGDSAAGSRAG
jgi:hypothetical protein